MKLLIIRFSSIGDIVLTSPVVRVLATATDKHQIHFITKRKFIDTIVNNPFIDKIYTFNNDINEVLAELKKEKYDYIIDLHKNLRSKRLILGLKTPAFSFDKLNYQKWIMVNFKKDIMNKTHIVNRYIDTLAFLGLSYDNKGLDYFINKEDEKIIPVIGLDKLKPYNIFVVGGAHQTKQIPTKILIDIGKKSLHRIVLLGGKDDISNATIIANAIGDNVLNLVGKLSLNESAAVIKYSNKVLTSDTGLMHIAAAMKKDILSVWGNTIPEFGMWALLPEEQKGKNHIFEVKNLKCRPCSKIGYDECPKKHFNCMLQQDVGKIVEVLNK